MEAVRNERHECKTTSRNEVRSALRKMKCGKEPGIDDIIADFHTREGKSIVEYLKMTLNVKRELPC